MLKITSISHFFPLSLLFRLCKSLPRSEHFSFIPLIVNILFQFLYHAYSSLLFLILLTPLITHTLSFPSYTSPFLSLLSTPPSTFTPSLNPLLYTPRLSPLIPPIILSCLHSPPFLTQNTSPFFPLLSTPSSTFTPSLKPLLFTPHLSPLIPPLILSCLHSPPFLLTQNCPSPKKTDFIPNLIFMLFPHTNTTLSTLYPNFSVTPNPVCVEFPKSFFTALPTPFCTKQIPLKPTPPLLPTPPLNPTPPLHPPLHPPPCCYNDVDQDCQTLPRYMLYRSLCTAYWACSIFPRK